jgi:hypothetical protein
MGRTHPTTGPSALALLITASLAAGLGACRPQAGGAAHTSLRFAVSFPQARSDSALDGRVLVMLGRADTAAEPRTLVKADPATTAQVFGIQVHGLAPGQEAIVGDTVFGFPTRRLADIPPGDYKVQALLNRYETFHLASGKTVELPPDRGEGQVWSIKPGNLFSAARTVHVDPASGGTIRLSMDSVIPEFEPLEDTPWIKHVRIQSKLLTEFWGRPMYVQATLLLPSGWAQHPNARYPLLVYQGHFHRMFYAPVRWRTRPPDDSLPPADTAWMNEHCPNGHQPDCNEHGYERIQQQHAYDFYRWWTGPNVPRVILMTIQHANPYYDDSYAVNSANLGPYGDAIMKELIPAVEKQYRGIGAGWSRVLFGGSTGGWESLGVQLFYPDDYAGTWVACPDPVDFHSYELVNIYDSPNAYRDEGPFGRVARPAHRDYLGRVTHTVGDENHMELAIATHGRSGGQWDIWQAVFSPQGEDGYPKPIWDKRTGVIDTTVAAYWRDHYDLTHMLQRDWKTLGPKLRGKLHVFVGEMDNFYLNDAVYRLEKVARGLSDPPADATFDYGARDEHCWSGDHDNKNWLSRLTYVERFLPQMAREMAARAPAGGDTWSWRY